MGKLRDVQRGDTIVEVLIAVAVVSSVLAISYSIMNSNLLILRNNQERTEASKIAQAQIEQLKTAWQTTDPSAFPGINGDGRAFCMAPGVTYGFSSGAPGTNAPLAGFPAACVDSFYHTGITYDSGQDRFLVRVQWDSISNGRSEVIMGYRVR